MARQSGLHTNREGQAGKLHFENPPKHLLPLQGAAVRLVTNRFSGLLVALVYSAGNKRAGEMLQIAPQEFISDNG